MRKSILDKNNETENSDSLIKIDSDFDEKFKPPKKPSLIKPTNPPFKKNHFYHHSSSKPPFTNNLVQAELSDSSEEEKLKDRLNTSQINAYSQNLDSFRSKLRDLSSAPFSSLSEAKQAFYVLKTLFNDLYEEITALMSNLQIEKRSHSENIQTLLDERKASKSQFREQVKYYKQIAVEIQRKLDEEKKLSSRRKKEADELSAKTSFMEKALSEKEKEIGRLKGSLEKEKEISREMHKRLVSEFKDEKSRMENSIKALARDNKFLEYQMSLLEEEKRGARIGLRQNGRFESGEGSGGKRGGNRVGEGVFENEEGKGWDDELIRRKVEKELGFGGDLRIGKEKRIESEIEETKRFLKERWEDSFL